MAHRNFDESRFPESRKTENVGENFDLDDGFLGVIFIENKQSLSNTISSLLT